LNPPELPFQAGAPVFTMRLTIRFAEPADAATIVSFIRGLAQYERALDAVKVSVPEIRSQMESGDPPFECLLAEYEGEPVGFALFFRNYSTWTGRCGLYLEDLFVREEDRGRGIGGALMRRLREIAAERGWARIDWAVLNWNTTAQSFYREHGGYPLERWTGWRLDIPGREPGKA
jgi:GNAT superfamily N-acetyltransferase